MFVQIKHLLKEVIEMKCIVGLGNPGKKYEKTRHNIGFMAIDALLDHYQITLDKHKFNGDYTFHMINGEKVFFLKPQTFMNVSGESIRPLLDYYQIDIEDLVVIYDDLDLPVGKIRLRETGGHGGHNGIRSTIDHLGTKQFKRIRLGIDRPKPPLTVVNYVLGDFTRKQQPAVEESIEQARDACIAWLDKPFVDVMTAFNTKA